MHACGIHWHVDSGAAAEMLMFVVSGHLDIYSGFEPVIIHTHSQVSVHLHADGS